MAQQEPSTKGIKILVGLGVAALVGIFVLVAVGVYVLAKDMVERQACISKPGEETCATGTLWDMIRLAGDSGGVMITYPDTDGQKTPGLGEEGSACGGPMRLPCMPGYSCEMTTSFANDVAQSDQELGICMKGGETAVPRVREGREACGAVAGRCGDGLVCKMSPGLETGVCIEATETSPRVLTLKLVGMQQSQGWYLAEPGTEVTMTVQAVNADTVSAYLTPKGKETASTRTKLLDLTRGKAGVFTGTFTVPEGLLADLDVIPRSDDGQESAMSVNVGVVE